MARDALQRMDVDTHWVYHRHWRAIQREDPGGWPVHAVAWLALLGECWRASDRRFTLEEAWPPALQGDAARTRDVLTGAGLLDRYGRIPQKSWDEWFGPTLRRVEAGQKGAAARWGNGPQSGGNATGHSGGNATAMPIASQPASQPYQPDSRARKRGRSNGKTEHLADVLPRMGFGDTYPDGTPRRKPDA